jgi:antitoxin YefM
MQVTTVSHFRNNIKEYMDAVLENSEEVIIAGPKGKSVVVLSLEEYESMRETDYLLASPANAERLRAGMEAINRGETIYKTLEELNIQPDK